MTQALALRRLLADAGHEVVAVVMGTSERREVPAFVRESIQAPLTFVPSPNFVADANDRSVQVGATIAQTLRNGATLYRGLDAVAQTIERHDPDVVVNFFEPMAGAAYLRHAPAVPLVSIAHQYMFLHPAYRFPPGRRLSRWGAQAFARLTTARASRILALSLYPAPDRPHERMAVMPPLLRPSVFKQPVGRTEPFYLVYVVNSGYADEVVRWHEQHPSVHLHCFWDRPDADEVEVYDDTLTFHALDGPKFLSMMARCRGLVSTAGFESIAEAMYFGKPVQVVPVEGHFEQWCNAFDTVRAGAGVRSDRFDLRPLQTLAERRDHAAPAQKAFRKWVQNGHARFVWEIEAAARPSRAAVPVSPDPVSSPDLDPEPAEVGS